MSAPNGIFAGLWDDLRTDGNPIYYGTQSSTMQPQLANTSVATDRVIYPAVECSRKFSHIIG